MHDRRTFACLALVLAVSFISSEELSAQQPAIDFDARAGIGLPVGDLGDVADVGPAFNVGVNFGVAERLLLRVTGGAEMFQGIELGQPLGNEGINDLEVDLIHVHAGGLYYLIPPEDQPLSVTLTGTAGATNFNVPRVASSVGTDAIEFELSELYFSAAGGVSVGYAVHEQVDLFVDGHTFFVFGNEEDTADMMQVVNEVQPSAPNTLETMWSVPVTAGVRLHF